MIQVTGQSLSREELEQRFVREHASFASGWALSRDGRTTCWTSPGHTLKIEVQLTPYEYKDPGCVGGLIGESIEWNELLYRREGQAWMPAAVHVSALKSKPKKTAKLVKARKRV